jgi:hypothetical protein
MRTLRRLAHNLGLAYRDAVNGGQQASGSPRKAGRGDLGKVRQALAVGVWL